MYIFIYISIYIYKYLYISIYIYWKKERNVLCSIAKEHNVLVFFKSLQKNVAFFAFFYLLCKRMLRSLHSFGFRKSPKTRNKMLYNLSISQRQAKSHINPYLHLLKIKDHLRKFSFITNFLDWRVSCLKTGTLVPMPADPVFTHSHTQ